jgi:hypothetical protein
MTARPEASADLLCPSAQPDWNGAVAIGVVSGTVEAPRVASLEKPLPISAALLRLAEPVQPTEVFRFAAPCVNEACRHHRQGACHLASKVVMMLASVVDHLPPCAARGRCRWFQQEGGEACRRCPQVVTDNVYPSAEMRAAADPNVVME